jgi:hypothetical protein
MTIQGDQPDHLNWISVGGFALTAANAMLLVAGFSVGPRKSVPCSHSRVLSLSPSLDNEV